jgi:hypothetical protein
MVGEANVKQFVEAQMGPIDSRPVKHDNFNISTPGYCFTKDHRNKIKARLTELCDWLFVGQKSFHMAVQVGVSSRI